MSDQPEILLIEDDETLCKLLAYLLRSEGYCIRHAHSGYAGLDEFQRRLPDLILLDLQLPDVSGLDILRRIRMISNLPVIFISGTSSSQDKVRALEQGADDYLTKPFHEKELLARIAALLRRIGWNPPADRLLEMGQLRIDLARRQASTNGTPIHLTPIEFAILTRLVQNAGEVVSHEELLHAVWGPDYRGHSVLRVNISRLRQKLEENPHHPGLIQTVPRKGYRLLVSQ